MASWTRDYNFWPPGSVNSVLIWGLTVITCHLSFLLADLVRYLLSRRPNVAEPAEPSEGSGKSSTSRQTRRPSRQQLDAANLCYTDTSADATGCWAGDFSLGCPHESSETWEFSQFCTDSVRNSDQSIAQMSSRYNCEETSWTSPEDPGEIDLESALWSLGFGYGDLDSSLRIPSRFMQTSAVLDDILIPTLLSSESNSACNCSCHPVDLNSCDRVDSVDVDYSQLMESPPKMVDSILNEKNRQFLESFYRGAASKIADKLPESSDDYERRKSSRKLTRSKTPLDLHEVTGELPTGSFECEEISSRSPTVNDNAFLAPTNTAMGNSFNSESSGFADSDSPVPKVEPLHDGNLERESEEVVMTPPCDYWATSEVASVREKASESTFVDLSTSTPLGPQLATHKQLRCRSHSTPSQADLPQFSLEETTESIFHSHMDNYQEILHNCAERIEECNFEDQFRQLQPLLPLGSRFNLETVRVTRLEVIEELRKLRSMVKRRSRPESLPLAANSYEMLDSRETDVPTTPQPVCQCAAVVREIDDLRQLILQSQQALHIQIAEATQLVQTAFKPSRHDRNS